MTTALVLSGGGARGSFQVGMLQGLMSLKDPPPPDFRVIRGVSVGALNGAIVSEASTATDPVGNFADKVNELEEFWRDIRDSRDIYRYAPGSFFLTGRPSVHTFAPPYPYRGLWDLIKDNVTIHDIVASGRDFAAGIVDYASGQYLETTANDDADFLRKLLASASIPILFPFVCLDPHGGNNGQILFDGGVRNITPLVGLLESNTEIKEVYVLLTTKYDPASTSNVVEKPYTDWTRPAVTSLIPTALRTLEILSDEVFINDLKVCAQWDDVLASCEGGSASYEKIKKVCAKHGKRRVKINVLAPKKLYGNDNDSMNFSRKFIAEAIEHGKTIGRDPDQWEPIGP